MSKFLNSSLRSLLPYTPGEQPRDKKYIKLNTNESPYAPSPLVREAVTEELCRDLRLYPDPTLKELKEAIAEKYKLPAEQIFVANGSDDVLAFCFMAFGEGGFACPDITYGFYPVFSELFNCELIEIPLREDFSIAYEDYISINRNIIIANPNAPTGLLLKEQDIKKIAESNPNNIVIIDEAYIDFSGSIGSLKLLEELDNIIIVQTFSKSRALAGLRIGYAMASKDIIEDLTKVKYSFNPYNINSLSIKAATAALQDKSYYEAIVNKIINTRERTKKSLDALGFYYLDSKANFILATHERVPGEYLYKELKERGVLVRYFNKEIINNYIRITIGTEEQMDILLKELKKIVEGWIG